MSIIPAGDKTTWHTYLLCSHSV